MKGDNAIFQQCLAQVERYVSPPSKARLVLTQVVGGVGASPGNVTLRQMVNLLDRALPKALSAHCTAAQSGEITRAIGRLLDRIALQGLSPNG